jgi:hypothetical protein
MKPNKPSSRKTSSAPPRPAKASSAKAKSSAVRSKSQGAGKRPAAKKTVKASPRKPARKALAPVPPILLEGDEPSSLPASGPGQRYALGPTAPVEKLEEEGQLPDAYGTRQLLLAARDPHWLYVHWDLTREQQRRYNARSADRHLVLRIYREAIGGRPLSEVHVHPESRHWFVHVDQAGTKYVSELGLYTKGGAWERISASGPTLTPPDSVSADVSAEFATIPFELPFSKMVSLVKEALRGSVPLAAALEELRRQGHPGLPEAGAQSVPGEWTPAQERALADILRMDQVRRVWLGSLEITELIRHQFVEEFAARAAAEFGAPTSPTSLPGGVSSPLGGEGPSERGFWLNVNAELIIYGATESSATVTIGGRKIWLRPDGTFSYRFALPDGRYELPVVAVSADQTDGRAAELRFGRETEYRGDVGLQAQDPELKAPELGNL